MVPRILITHEPTSAHWFPNSLFGIRSVPCTCCRQRENQTGGALGPPSGFLLKPHYCSPLNVGVVNGIFFQMASLLKSENFCPRPIRNHSDHWSSSISAQFCSQQLRSNNSEVHVQLLKAAVPKLTNQLADSNYKPSCTYFYFLNRITQGTRKPYWS